MTPLEADKTPFQECPPSWMDASVMSATRRRQGVKPAPRGGLAAVGFLALIGVAVAIAGMVAVSVWGPDDARTASKHRALAVAPVASPPLSSAAVSSPPLADSTPLPAASTPRSAVGDEPSASEEGEAVAASTPSRPAKKTAPSPPAKPSKQAWRPNAKRGH